MTAETALATMQTGDVVYDIGQLDQQAKSTLDQLARAGEIVKIRVMRPWFEHATCEKTAYLMPR